MERRRLLGAWILICLLFVSDGRELKIKHEDYSHIYNHTLAVILAEYASAVYMTDLTALFTWTCSRCTDMTVAFVGVDHDLNSTIIAFRGTQEHSIQNWIEDLFWKQLDLDYPDMPDAMVHHGFYSAYHKTTLRPGILSAVQRTMELYGDLPIMVTGHSMGGAMAAFCALDLTVSYGARNVQLMTFGQPRIGNADFASYFSKHVPKAIRVTNEHDIVPHLPPYYSYLPRKSYHHFPREVWLHNAGVGSLVYMVEEICDGTGEDPSCSRSVSGNSIQDHLTYYGIRLSAPHSWGSCRIVADRKLMQYYMDGAGNIVMSRDSKMPSFLKLVTQNNTGSSSIYP